MRSRGSLRFLLLLLSVALPAACVRQTDSAVGGAPPPMVRPVGPMPGRGELPSDVNPLANEAGAAEEGRRLFVQYNCAGCHGGRAGGGMGPSLRDADWIYGNAPGAIRGSIAEGRANGMPSWGTRIPDRQIWQLVAYIQTLRTDQEPEKPR